MTMPLIWTLHACQAEREAMAKLASAAEEEAGRLKKKLAEAAEELEEAMRKHLAEQRRIQVIVVLFLGFQNCHCIPPARR